ncbi:MAG: hypothetical protein M3297_03570 [Thermoproteota archaeon]|nr:hypothetical protein [Thermoproteota archaeon]
MLGITGSTQVKCRISRCRACGEFLDSKRQLREHIDRQHRITNSKVVAAGRKRAVDEKERGKQRNC